MDLWVANIDPSMVVTADIPVHEPPPCFSNNGGYLHNIGIVNCKRSSAASKICVPRPVDGKGFEQEVIVRSGVAGDVANLLKLLRDGVTHDKVVENISEAICE